jgi:serine/threonine protein kinase
MGDDASTQIATALDDRYRFERELGAGGMATVYLARDLKQFAKSAAWAPFRADAEGVAMLRSYGFA